MTENDVMPTTHAKSASWREWQEWRIACDEASVNQRQSVTLAWRKSVAEVVGAPRDARPDRVEPRAKKHRAKPDRLLN